MNIEQKLSNARTLLNDLGNALTDLVNVAPDVFEDELLQDKLQDFRQVYDEATERLANPSLRIAMIGTTSSGKSTIVNALIGRRIAPIEAGEMSGGVLRIRHSQDCRLKIEATDDAVWETGEWTDLSDEEIYNRIRAVMYHYHEARRKKDYLAPQIEVSLPILPACDKSLSGLPEGLNIEFVDLPGLKSVQDHKNLEIIQSLVGKAFNLVALDYLQVDEEHRQVLLNELNNVVKYWQGRLNSTIFILNRVDSRSSDDLPLDMRIEMLQQEIQTLLSLAELPDIIPFNARLLYNAQCSWGHNSWENSSGILLESRMEFLKRLFLDSASKIEEQVKGKRDLRRWFDEIKYDLDDNLHVEDEKVRMIVKYALQWSGGQTLWDRIKKRIEESFAELVISPILVNVFESYDSFSHSVNLLIQTRKITNIEEIKEKQEQLIKFRNEFPDLAEKVNEDFAQELQDYIKAFKSRDQTKISQIIQKAKDKKRKGFQEIFDAVDDIEADLNASIIIQVRDAFKNKNGAYDLEDKLQEVITPSLAKDVAREYDHVSRRISDFTSKKDGYLVKKVKMDDSKKIKELEHDEKYVRLLFYTMEDALTARADFTIQAKQKDFITALDCFIQGQITRLKFCISEEILESLDIEQAVMSDVRKKLNENLTTLPEKFFNFSADIKENTLTQREKTGTKAQKRSREVGSCLNKRTETYTEYVDQHDNIRYKQLLIPDIETMAKQWSSGIENSKYGKGGLCDILFDWITHKLNYASNLFDESVNNILNLTEKCLDEQFKKLEEQQLELEKLAKLESCHNKANNIRQELDKILNLMNEEVIKNELL